MGHRVLCLLPARNAATDLPGFFASARLVCDGIVALDDGSTDDTGLLLANEPQVVRLLGNPVRDDYGDWDDAANRNRLLEAAAEFDPEWILVLDADERIDPSDAAALQALLATDALPGCAYGFRHVPMRDDADHFLPRYQWVYRLFSHAPGQRFPAQRLHYVPVPTSIPRSRWIRTTLRIQHLGGMTTERRLARFAKYLEADPHQTFQSDYAHLLDEPAPTELRRWRPRPSGLPVLLGSDAELEASESEDAASADKPIISAIVIARDSEGTIAQSLASVVSQELDEPFEVIAVVSGTDRTAAIVRDQFPSVRLVELDRPALPGDARNAGLEIARGHYVTFPGSHIELPPGSLAARVAAHRRGYAMVTPVTLNGTTTRSGWASYFLDHHANLPGQGPAELNGPPAHCSYARAALLEVGGFPEGIRTGEDTAVNRALVRRGYVAVRDPRVTMRHRSPCRTVGALIRHHFTRGRGWSRLLLDEQGAKGRLLRSDAVKGRGPVHIQSRLATIDQHVRQADAGLLGSYQSVRRLILIGAVASWLGMWWELLRPASGKAEILFGRPVRTLAVATRCGSTAGLSVVRLDAIRKKVQVIALPPDLRVTDREGQVRRLDAAVLGTMAGELSVAGGHLRALAESITHIPIDGHLSGHADRVGRIIHAVLGSGRPSPPVSGSRFVARRVGAWLGAVRFEAATVGGGAQTSEGVLALMSLAWQARSADAITSVRVANAPDRPVPVNPPRGRSGRAHPARDVAHDSEDATADLRRPWMA